MASNPFPQPSALDLVLLKELATVASSCYDRTWSHGTAGNFSLRGSAPHLIWQSPGGVLKNQLDPRLFIPVNLTSGRPVEPGERKVSGEMPVHLGIYRTVASAKCVVHCHPPHMVAASFHHGEELVFQGEEMQKAVGCHSHSETLRIPVIKNLEPEEMMGFAKSVGEHVDADVPMIMLQNHGVYAWGKSPLAALTAIEAVEFLCQTQVLKK